MTTDAATKTDWHEFDVMDDRAMLRELRLLRKI
jgi:hypothetical protein